MKGGSAHRVGTTALEVCLGALPSFPAAKEHYKNQCFRNITHLEGLKMLSAAQVGTYKTIKTMCFMFLCSEN